MRGTMFSCMQDGMAVTEWLEDDPNADPSARFPYGT